MGQVEIYEYFKKYPHRWYNSKEIYNVFCNISRGSVRVSLNKLTKHGFLKKKTIKNSNSNSRGVLRDKIEVFKYND